MSFRRFLWWQILLISLWKTGPLLFSAGSLNAEQTQSSSSPGRMSGSYSCSYTSDIDSLIHVNRWPAEEYSREWRLMLLTILFKGKQILSLNSALPTLLVIWNFYKHIYFKFLSEASKNFVQIQSTVNENIVRRFQTFSPKYFFPIFSFCPKC